MALNLVTTKILKKRNGSPSDPVKFAIKIFGCIIFSCSILLAHLYTSCIFSTTSSITDVRITDAGYYNCTAINQFGANSENVRLAVRPASGESIFHIFRFQRSVHVQLSLTPSFWVRFDERFYLAM